MVTSKEIPGFFAAWSELSQDRYVRAVYRFAPSGDPRLAAASICAEQSTAMWHRIGVSEDLRTQFGAKVLRLTPLSSDAVHPWELELAHPHENFGPRLANLLVALAGEGAFHVPGVRRLRLIDIHFPDAYLQQFCGPQFGVAGLRLRLNVHHRPIFLGVVKPNIGLSPSAFATLAAAAWRGGLDIAKDDEMQADTVWSPVRDRVRYTTQALRQLSPSGTNRWYLANITDDPDRAVQLLHDLTVDGVQAVLVNPAWSGLGLLSTLRRHSTIPLMGHFAGVAAFGKSPEWGVSSVLFTKLQRIAGADLIVFPGFGERMGSSDADVQGSIAACLDPLGPIAPALPIPGGSDSAATLPGVYKKIGHADFGFIAGRGVFGHPDGPEAGARSLHQAWHALQTESHD